MSTDTHRPVQITGAEARRLVGKVQFARACWTDACVWARQLHLARLGGHRDVRREDYAVAIDAAANIERAEAFDNLCFLSLIEESPHGRALVDAVIDGDLERAGWHAMLYLQEVSSE